MVKRKRKVPMKNWVIERPSDSADYLDGPPPGYMTPAEEKRFHEHKRSKKRSKP